MENKICSEQKNICMLISNKSTQKHFKPWFLRQVKPTADCANNRTSKYAYYKFHSIPSTKNEQADERIAQKSRNRNKY